MSSPPRCVLIVEDNPAMRRTLSEILEYEGYETIGAADGRDGLKVLADHPVDILLLDLAMPNVSGVELLQQIEVPPPVVIIHSAFAYYTPEEVEHQVGRKVFLSLRKPVPAADLLAAVAEAAEELDRI